MALEKYSLEIKENLDFRLVWADMMSKNDSGLFSSPRFPKRENFSLWKVWAGEQATTTAPHA